MRPLTGTLNAVNELLLGLGPFGSWRVGIEGKWLALDLEGESEGAQAVRPVKHRVVFDRLSLRLVGLMGLTLPSWLPPVRGGARDERWVGKQTAREALGLQEGAGTAVSVE